MKKYILMFLMGSACHSQEVQGRQYFPWDEIHFKVCAQYATKVGPITVYSPDTSFSVQLAATVDETSGWHGHGSIGFGLRPVPSFFDNTEPDSNGCLVVKLHGTNLSGLYHFRAMAP